jgi:DNA-directed RNA polymerase subunit RPC12/RpoP
MTTVTRTTDPARTIAPTLTLYTCPTCPASVHVASDTAQVGHRCPKRLDKWQTWTREETS